MIIRAKSPDNLQKLPENGVESQKIRSLLLAYGTKYDFCRFYTAENAVLAQLNGDFIICDYGKNDIDEIADFLRFCSCSSIFCSEKLGKMLSERHCVKAKFVNLMRFDGDFSEEKPEVISLSEAYSAIKTGFDFEFEPWYLDMSHRVRHGISRLYGLCGSALAVQYAINGQALISQVTTLPEMRGKGCASRLLAAVCGELKQYAVYVVCEDELLNFYQKNGFCFTELKCIINL